MRRVQPMTTHIRSAARALRDGHLVAFPTETVFGLGADASDSLAVSRIFATKGRPKTHPLILHVSGIDVVAELADDVPDFALSLGRAFWPGPLTLVLPRSSAVSDDVTGGQSTVGIRVPRHEVALDLLRAFEEMGGLGVAAPSANRFGRVSPTTAQAVREELADALGPHDVVLDGEPSDVGIESTIVDCTGSLPSILRPGSVTAEMIEQTTGLTLGPAATGMRASGSFASHYAPAAAVHLDTVVHPGEGLIALAVHETPPGVIRLAAPQTVDDYARRLYAALRRADHLGLTRIVAMTPPGTGVAMAIRDRLYRASHSSSSQE
jgi:L-threonylcarbamoyladenylate synthase